MQTSSNHERICSQWHLVHRWRWRPVIAATDLCLRLCYFVGMSSRWRARVRACVFCIHNLMFFLTMHHSIDLFQFTNLMHTSFILLQYIRYIIILNVFRAVLCSSSGGQIVSLQHLVSSLSVNDRTVRRLRADCTAVYRERRYQRL